MAVVSQELLLLFENSLGPIYEMPGGKQGTLFCIAHP